jgi:hypothetical protein
VTSQTACLLGIPGAAFLLSLVWPSIRRAYGHAIQCLKRYPVVWKMPVGFAFTYGLFDFVNLAIVRWRGGMAWPPLIDWHGRLSEPSVDWQGALSVIEQLAGTWNCLVSVFPISVFAALLFVCNYRSLTRELLRTLRQRFGSWGWLLMAALLLCALAEIVKPALLLALPELTTRVPWQPLLTLATILNALAFAFEYLMGTALQLYLLLTIYGWVRGLQFDDRRMLPFAVRRLGFVIKWSLVIIAASLLFMHVPFALDAWWTGGIRWPTDGVRLILAVGMLVCGAVQIQLALHNDTLAQAFEANRRFLHDHGLAYAGLLAGAASLLFLLQILRRTGEVMLGNSLAAVGWTMVIQMLCAAVGGWILAAWVCFYQERAGGKEIAY